MLSEGESHLVLPKFMIQVKNVTLKGLLEAKHKSDSKQMAVKAKSYL